MAGWFDWIGGLGATEVAAGGSGHLADGTLWLAVVAGLGALALAGLAARSHVFARDRRPPILHGTRAARGEVGQAVPMLLLILLLGILAAELVLAILTL